MPQGPFAYVLSLTPWEERTWRGGETTLLRPDVLDYWRGFDSSRGLEVGDLLMEVEPEFNRLLCFDARVPHGVRRVDGVRIRAWTGALEVSREDRRDVLAGGGRTKR